MLHDLLATATDLERWASLRQSQDTFPELLRRLVSATTLSLTKVSFPSAEGVQLPGWDGHTTTTEATGFVPMGVAGWELGTNQDRRRKAEEDYRTRTANPLDIQPAAATFIFCTLRRWPERHAWAATCQAQGYWREVRAYDADDLLAWLTTAPATHLWLSRLLHKQPAGVKDLDYWWQAWAAQTSPRFPVDWLLAGRAAAQASLATWLTSPTAEPAHSVFASTADEARAFVASCVLALPEPARSACLARTIVVDSEAAWQQLLPFGGGLLLLPNFESERLLQLQAAATQQGHRVLLPRAANELRANETPLPPLDRELLQQGLEAAGFAQLDAAERAALARRSFAAFHRTLLTDKSLQHLWWQTPAIARQLLPVLLLNRWQGSATGDQLLAAELSGQSYAELEQQLLSWAQQPATPVRQLGEEWFVLDPADAWEQTAPYLTPALLTAFGALVQGVLGTPLARFQLPVDERRFARLQGPPDDYSSTLRVGLAATLGLLGTRTPPTAAARLVPAWVDEQVQQLLAQALADPTGHRLTSLSPQLPVLAEAAPDAFLTAVLQNLQQPTPALLHLFEEEPGLFHTTAHHTGLLWALESLAWPAQHLTEATRALATLARLDPGGQSANRPLDSLATILLPWRPQTNASVAERLLALDGLRQIEPAVSWQLLLQLVPGQRDTSMGTHLPTFQWRDWDVNPGRDVDWADYYQFVGGLTRRLLVAADTDLQRWAQLVGALPDWLANVPDSTLHDQVLAQLSQLATMPVLDSERLPLIRALRSLLHQHRSVPTAEWAWGEERLAPLQILYDQLQPVSLPIRHAWLFGEWPPLPEGLTLESDEEAEQLIMARQQQALAEVLAADGEAALAQLLPLVPSAYWLGLNYGQTSYLPEEAKLRLFQQYAATTGELTAKFVQGLAMAVTNLLGSERATAIAYHSLADWQPVQTALWLTNLPMTAATWHLARELGPAIETAYWQRAATYVPDPTEAAEAAQCFLTAQRPAAATKVLVRLRRQAPHTLPMVLVLATLEALLAAQSTSGIREIPRHELEALLEELPRAAPAERAQAVRLAFLFSATAPLKNPQLLREELARNPAFFVELLTGFYKPDNVTAAQLAEMTDDEREIKRNFAMQAGRVLYRWDTAPGCRPDNSLDGEYLRQWVATARTLAAGQHVTRGFEMQLGKLLSHSPPGPDGVWPPPAVCQLLEEAASDTVARHAHTGRYNLHGRAHLVDGGNRESRLAADYARWAEQLRAYPVTARLLRGLRDTFAGKALDERQQADREAQFG